MNSKNLNNIVNLTGMKQHIEFLREMGEKLCEHNLREAAEDTISSMVDLRNVLNACTRLQEIEEKWKPVWDLVEKVEGTSLPHKASSLTTKIIVENDRTNERYKFAVPQGTTIQELVEDILAIEHPTFWHGNCNIQVNWNDMVNDEEYFLREGDVVTIKPIKFCSGA